MKRAGGIAALLALWLALAGPVVAEDVFRLEESADLLDKLHARGSTVEIFERAPGNPAVRWTGTKGAPVAVLSIRGLPEDLAPYRTLRFHVRCEPAGTESSYLRFVAGNGFLGGYMPPPSAEWKLVEFNLPDLRASPGFDPAEIQWMQLAILCPDGFTMEFDDIEFVKAGAGWRYSGEEEAARQSDPRFLVDDFESDHWTLSSQAEQSSRKRVPTEKPKGNALQWLQAPSGKGGWLDFRRLPDDLSAYRILRFRARVTSGDPEGVLVRFRADEAILEAWLPALSAEWRTVEILIPEMQMRAEFDPRSVLFLRLVCFQSEGHCLEIDDIVLLKEGGGWRYSAEERREMGIDPTAPTFRLADFERRNALAYVGCGNSEIEMVELKKRRRVTGHHLRWTVPKESGQAAMSFIRVPTDLRPYRTLRFRVRINKMPEGGLMVCFQCGKGVLRRYIQSISKRWQEIEVPLPEMTADDLFNPEEVTICRFVFYGDESFVLEIDDVELVKGAGGWKMTEKEQIAFVFGQDRARKVRQIDTDHFIIWTDSAAARKKFPKALEKTHDFVVKELGLKDLGIEEMPGKLPVYIFQNSNLYFDFCVRKGWSKAAAEATAGHAAGSYFATYYQAPGSATVTHELTHSIVHRTLGEGGGSWYQEGIAVHVENRWERKSAAAVFAPRLRNGAYVPLAEFMKISQLIGEEDVKGGPKSSHWLYAQAGAFFEFLLRGPYAETAPDRIKAISVLDFSAGDVREEIERILGRKLDQIEKDWKAWGGKPPAEKRR